MAEIPYISPAENRPELRNPGQDMRVRTDMAEVVDGIEEQGKLFQVTGEDYAIGPRNIRYSTATLLELEGEGKVVAQDSNGKVHAFANFPAYLKKIRGEGTGTDDEGIANNSFPDTLTWKRA